MREILFYAVVIVACLFIIVWATKTHDNKCLEKGGQLITYSTKLGHGCIYPPKK